MFDDDDMNEESASIEHLLKRFEALKNGNTISLLDEEEFELIIEYFFQHNNDTEALLACDMGIVYYPHSSSLLLLKAEIYTQTQKYGQALKTLDIIEQFDPANLEAVLLKSEIFVSQSRYEDAIQHLNISVALFEATEQVDILLELSDIYDEYEEFDAVFDTLERVLQLDPKNEEALQKFSFWAEFTQRFEESVQLHLKITEEEPYCTLAWFNLGAAYQGLKLYEKAIDAYEYCIAIDEYFEFAYRNLADAPIRLKKYDAALEALQKHLDIGKAEDIIFEAMGYCYEKQKKFAIARQFYRKASQLSPEDDLIFYKIGETYSKEQAWEKAAKSYTEAFKRDTENVLYLVALGNSLMELHLLNDAINCFIDALRIKATSKNAWIALIKALYQKELYDEALLQLDLAREYCGDKVEFDYLQAAVLFGKGKSKEALTYLEEALFLNKSQLKIFTKLNPDFIKRAAVAELIARYKKK